MMHIDQGVAVTSHAAKGKTVDHVIASAPVEAFRQVNQAQLWCFALESSARYDPIRHMIREQKHRPPHLNHMYQQPVNRKGVRNYENR